MAGSAVQFGRMSIGVVAVAAGFSGAFTVAAGAFAAHVVEETYVGATWAT